MRLCDELEAAWTKIRQDEAVRASASYTFKSGDLEVTNNVIGDKSLVSIKSLKKNDFTQLY